MSFDHYCQGADLEAQLQFYGAAFFANQFPAVNFFCKKASS